MRQEFKFAAYGKDFESRREWQMNRFRTTGVCSGVVVRGMSVVGAWTVDNNTEHVEVLLDCGGDSSYDVAGNGRAYNLRHSRITRRDFPELHQSLLDWLVSEFEKE